MFARRGPVTPRVRGRAVTFTTLAFIAVIVVLVAQGAAARPAQAMVAKGLVDHRLEYHGGIDLAPVPAYAEMMGPSSLNATWTRVLAYWDQLMPYPPGDERWAGKDLDGDGFADAYVTELDTVVQALRAQGLNVILTGSDPPAWTRDTRYKKYWAKNATTAVVRIGDARVAAAFKKYASILASHFAPMGVRHFEVWNEPNLRLIPQIVGKRVVGPEVYRRMLVEFSKGAHSGNRSAVVIAGATSRFGSNGTDPGSTSPQWFARYLRSHGALKWFDAYSHHPYTTRGADDVRPSAPPPRPKVQVTLGNLPVLLRIFPTRSFYLTEYCYSTGPKDAFVVVVSKADQARYLRQAYALLETRAYRQVKVMLWFLVRDWQASPQTDPDLGVFTGLIDFDGQRKPAWYAFAGGNKLTVAAPASTSSGAPFEVVGALTTRVGPGQGVTVKLQWRNPTGSTWHTAASVKTDAAGAYVFPMVKQSTARRYRVIWDGVRESPQVTVTIAT